jgi:pimeloyl-ACP methyl ester carboxylesterase
MNGIIHRFIEPNGINMHIAEVGEGPLVVLCHGFPECWYSWRHQLPALANAGYHAVAPDQRGYGETDRPPSIDAYNIFQLVGDIVGLVHALGEEQAVIVGHDWGSPVAWHCALLRPDMFHAVALLSVPYVQRSWKDIRPTEAMKPGGKQFYQLYFQEPGKAERDLEASAHSAGHADLMPSPGDAVGARVATWLLQGGRFPEPSVNWLVESAGKLAKQRS